MRPVPVVFHLGPLAVHTYGIGLAVTFWFAYRYFAHRLRRAGYPDRWLATTFVQVVVAAVVGARLLHVVANLGDYRSDPLSVLAVWEGGLSSFGGLLLAVPVGFVSARRRCPELRAAVAADLVTPVLVAAWAVGRVLGPQLMVAGGGKPTGQWFGMEYADEVGRRLPVPVFQALECLAVYIVLVGIERAFRRRGAAAPLGAVTGLGIGLWSLSRFVDEYLWLPHDAGSLPIEVAGVVLFVAGIAFATWRLAGGRRARRRPADGPQGPGGSGAPGAADPGEAHVSVGAHP